MTNPPIDILAIASRRRAECWERYTNTLYLNASPAAAIHMDAARVAWMVAEQDHNATVQLILALA